MPLTMPPLLRPPRPPQSPSALPRSQHQWFFWDYWGMIHAAVPWDARWIERVDVLADRVLHRVLHRWRWPRRALAVVGGALLPVWRWGSPTEWTLPARVVAPMVGVLCGFALAHVAVRLAQWLRWGVVRGCWTRVHEAPRVAQRAPGVVTRGTVAADRRVAAAIQMATGGRAAAFRAVDVPAQGWPAYDERFAPHGLPFLRAWLAQRGWVLPAVPSVVPVSDRAADDAFPEYVSAWYALHATGAPDGPHFAAACRARGLQPETVWMTLHWELYGVWQAGWQGSGTVVARLAPDLRTITPP